MDVIRLPDFVWVLPNKEKILGIPGILRFKNKGWIIAETVNFKEVVKYDHHYDGDPKQSYIAAANQFELQRQGRLILKTGRLERILGSVYDSQYVPLTYRGSVLELNSGFRGKLLRSNRIQVLALKYSGVLHVVTIDEPTLSDDDYLLGLSKLDLLHSKYVSFEYMNRLAELVDFSQKENLA